MISDGWYEKIFSICFQVKSKKIGDISIVNDCLRQFRRILEGAQINKDKLEIRIESVSEFAAKRSDLETLVCSEQIKLCIVDDRKNWDWHQNNTIEPVIREHFEKLKFSDGRGDEALRITVSDICFAGEEKSGLWPDDVRLAMTMGERY